MEEIVKPKSFKYDNHQVYIADQVYKYDSYFFKEIDFNEFNKSIIKKFKLVEEQDYILLEKEINCCFCFINIFKNPETILCLKKEWVESKVPRFKDIINEE
jgi:hypothetical protein